MSDPLDAVIRDVLRAHHEPPREVSYPLVASAAYREGGTGLLAFLGVLFVGVGLLAAAEPLPLLVPILFVAMGLFVLMAPGVLAFRRLRALRIGLLTQAELVDHSYSRKSDATIRSMKSGFLEGTVLVHHPLLGDFDAPLQSDSSWAGKLKKGQVIDVLVAPDRQKLLFAVGPHDPQSSESRLPWSAQRQPQAEEQIPFQPIDPPS